MLDTVGVMRSRRPAQAWQVLAAGTVCMCFVAAAHGLDRTTICSRLQVPYFITGSACRAVGSGSGHRYVLHPFAAKYSHWMWH
jgi:hypothetical protein